MAFLTFSISLLALLMASLDNRRSLVELQKTSQADYTQGQRPRSLQARGGGSSYRNLKDCSITHPRVPKTNDASHEPSSSSEAAPPPLPQSISQGSGFSDSSSSLNLDHISHSNVQEKNVPPGDDGKSKGEHGSTALISPE